MACYNNRTEHLDADLIPYRGGLASDLAKRSIRTGSMLPRAVATQIIEALNLPAGLAARASAIDSAEIRTSGTIHLRPKSRTC